MCHLTNDVTKDLYGDRFSMTLILQYRYFCRVSFCCKGMIPKDWSC